MCWLAQVRFPVGIKNVSFLETMKRFLNVKDGREKHGEKKGVRAEIFWYDFHPHPPPFISILYTCVSFYYIQ
jgi:hypothetical protein